MNVNELTSLKSIAILDMGYIARDNPDARTFLSISTAFGNFAKNANILNYYILIPESFPPLQTNFKCEVTRDSMFTTFMKVNKKYNPKLMVTVGKFETMLEYYDNYKIKYGIIVTDDEYDLTSHKQLKKGNIRVLPTRVLIEFATAYWWKITPMEQIDSKSKYKSVLDEGYLHEVALLNQLGVQELNKKDYMKAFDIFNECIQLQPDSVLVRFSMLGMLLEQIKDNQYDDMQKQGMVSNAYHTAIEVDRCTKDAARRGELDAKNLADYVVKQTILFTELSKFLQGEQKEKVKALVPVKM